jgi:pimeloyl-ACP methyl ester carboxylesterase
VAGEEDAPPVVLVHGIYAGASSYEFRKNFEALATGGLRVYALDLLGCGLSERPERPYEPGDVTAQVEDFVREVVLGEGSRGRAHLVASSLSAALVVPALVGSPRLWGRVVLIVPTGFGSLDRPSGRLGDFVYALFRAPVLGDALYNALVSRRGLRYYLGRMAYHDPKFVTDGLIDDYYGTAHQRGAKWLPAAFVAGRLNLGVSDLFGRVPQRVLVAWGEEAETVPLDRAQRTIVANPRARIRVFRDSALLPHDERAETFNEEAIRFLSEGR